MQDWNVVVTVQEGQFAWAWETLEPFGSISKTPFYNVLALKVPDISGFLAKLEALVAKSPSVLDIFGRMMPVTVTFTFQSPEEFESKVKKAVEPWLLSIVGKTFHVRMHRRGFKGRLSSQEEERLVDEYMLERLKKKQLSAQVRFGDPDVIIALETIAQRGGMSLWTREDRRRYPFLKLD